MKQQYNIKIDTALLETLRARKVETGQSVTDQIITAVTKHLKGEESKCKRCKKKTSKQVLEENGKLSYGRVCDSCAQRIDELQDEQQQG